MKAVRFGTGTTKDGDRIGTGRILPQKGHIRGLGRYGLYSGIKGLDCAFFLERVFSPWFPT